MRYSKCIMHSRFTSLPGWHSKELWTLTAHIPIQPTIATCFTSRVHIVVNHNQWRSTLLLALYIGFLRGQTTPLHYPHGVDRTSIHHHSTNPLPCTSHTGKSPHLAYVHKEHAAISATSTNYFASLSWLFNDQVGYYLYVHLTGPTSWPPKSLCHHA